MTKSQMGAPGIAVRAAIQAQKQNTDASIVSDPAEKLKAMAMDRAARAGVSVYEMGSGGYAVGWSAREGPDLRSLQRVLTQMEVAA